MTELFDDPMDDLWIEGRWEELIPMAQAQLRAARKAGDGALEADALGQLGFLFGQTERATEEGRAIRQELQVRRRLGVPLGLARALGTMAGLLLDRGREAEAMARLGEALAVYRSLGQALEDPLEIAELGQLYQQAGCHAQAREVFREALGADSGPAQFVLRASVLQSLSRSHEALGDLREAMHCQFEALANRHRVALDCADGLCRLAELHLKAGERWQAVLLLEEALASALLHGNAPMTEVIRERLAALRSRPARTPKRFGQLGPYGSC